jgi:hypothetical protein
MVGRLFVSLNEVLVLVLSEPNVATLQVASCRDDKGFQMLFSVQLEEEYSPAFKIHFIQRTLISRPRRMKSVATFQVASCRDDKGYQMLFSVQLEGEYSPPVDPSMMTSVLKLTFISIMSCIYTKMSALSRRALKHAAESHDQITFDDVSTIWVYKTIIIRMVGRLFVSLDEVLGTISHVVCGDMPV